MLSLSCQKSLLCPIWLREKQEAETDTVVNKQQIFPFDEMYMTLAYPSCLDVESKQLLINQAYMSRVHIHEVQEKLKKMHSELIKSQKNVLLTTPQKMNYSNNQKVHEVYEKKEKWSSVSSSETMSHLA